MNAALDLARITLAIGAFLIVAWAPICAALTVSAKEGPEQFGRAWLGGAIVLAVTFGLLAGGFLLLGLGG